MNKNSINNFYKRINVNYPIIMGILNFTPDSFYDGGCYNTIDKAINHVDKMIKNGAEIIDVGGESTRPGYKKIGLQEELDRVIPILEKIKKNFNVYISIDTSKIQVVKEAIKIGVDIINNVNFLKESDYLKIIYENNLFISIMHNSKIKNKNVIQEINRYFYKKIDFLNKNKIRKKNIIIDPGFGFNKNLAQNYQILSRLNKLNKLKIPMLVGISRKSMIGNLLDISVKNRLIGSISCAVIAALQNVKIIRVHDVEETAQAIKIVQATILAKEMDF